tara:strand:+ start:7437 stop:8549 length:1113 start_codon:yes stop_codon:yes gene_type:complete
MNKKIKIGILGTRGIPNKYGGFEQFAQYLSESLVQNNFDVTVYNPHFHTQTKSIPKEIKIIHKWCPEKYFGAASHIIYDFLCLKDALKKDLDIVLELGYQSSSLSLFFVKKGSSKIIFNMDGMEWKRQKWSYTIKAFTKWAEKMAVMKADYLIADNDGIKKYIKNYYNKDSIMIPYGSTIFTNPKEDLIKKYNLIKKKYFLIISRIEPENNIEMILDGYVKSESLNKMIIVGNYNNKYGKFLLNKYKNYDKIFFLNGIYDMNIINNLRYFSKYYFHGHSVGGTNPSLLEAMACKVFIISHNNIFNKNVLGKDAYYFKTVEDVSSLLINTKSLEEKRDVFINNNINKINKIYNWSKINSNYINFFKEIIKK